MTLPSMTVKELRQMLLGRYRDPYTGAGVMLLFSWQDYGAITGCYWHCTTELYDLKRIPSKLDSLCLEIADGVPAILLPFQDWSSYNFAAGSTILKELNSLIGKAAIIRRPNDPYMPRYYNGATDLPLMARFTDQSVELSSYLFNRKSAT